MLHIISENWIRVAAALFVAASLGCHGSLNVSGGPSGRTISGNGGSVSNTASPNTSTSGTASGSTGSLEVGNVGDAYEGGSVPAPHTGIPACGTLNPVDNEYYLVTQDIGVDPSTECLTIEYPPATGFIVDLGGHTVSGSIVVNTNHLSGTVIFHGRVTCNIAAGCIQIQGFDTPSAQARLHHLTVNQLALNAFSVYATWEPTSTGTPVPAFKMDHIDGAYPGGQPSSNRNYFLYFTGPYVGLEASYNSVILPSDASACQGIVAFEAPASYIHNNFISLPDPMNITGDSCRAILLDSEGKVGAPGTGGNSIAAYNTIYVGKNRAIRVRAETGDAIHDNSIYNIRLGGRLGAIHVGECDLESESASAEVNSNYFEINDGNAVVASGSPSVSANIHDNTVACRGGNCTAAGYMAETDALFSGNNGANLTLNNNNTTVLTTAGKAAVRVCGPGTNPYLVCTISTAESTASVCNSGNAVGQGTINLVTTSPCL